MFGPEIGRTKDGGRFLVVGQVAKPAAYGAGLAVAEVGKWHVHIAGSLNFDKSFALGMGQVTGNIPGAFTMADDVDKVRPFLLF